MTKKYKNSIEEVRAIKENMAKKAGYDVWKLLGYKKRPALSHAVKSNFKAKAMKVAIPR